MKKNYLFLCSLLLLSSCAPKITTSFNKHYKSLKDKTSIVVYEKNDTLPSPSETLGTVKIVDYGLTSGFNYNSLIESAKTEAAKVGGNVIQINKLLTPTLLNPVYLLKADILKAEENDIHLPAKPKSTLDVNTVSYSRWRLALNGGYSYDLGSNTKYSDPGVAKYYNKLKVGRNYGGELSYFAFNGELGFGLNYENINSQNSMDGLIILTNVGTVKEIGVLSDNKTIQYVGPSITAITRQIKNNKVKDALTLNVGMGYLSFHDTQQVINDNFELSSSTVGMRCAIGYDYYISKSLALGVQLSYISGLLRGYDKFDGTETTSVRLNSNLRQLNLSLGLRFNK